MGNPFAGAGCETEEQTEDGVWKGIVWIDFRAKQAFAQTGISNRVQWAGCAFKGFTADRNDDEYVGPGYWITYILQRSRSPLTRVAVVILNKELLQQILPPVIQHCINLDLDPPEFIVVTENATPDKFTAHFEIKADQITNDWNVAAKQALALVGKKPNE